MEITGVSLMTRNLRHIRLMAILTLCLAAPGLLAQDDDKDVPANASWRPQAPKLEEAPPEVQPDHGNFQVQRPKASLPSFKRPDRKPASGADLEQEDAAPKPAPEPASSADDTAGAGPAADSAGSATPALRESRVESTRPPASVDVPDTDGKPITDPVPLPDTAVQPDYPRDALLRGVEGYVELEFTVTAKGSVEDVAVLDSKPKGEFEGTVRAAIKHWKFKPARQDGKPVDERVRHRFDFKLDN